ncbi:MAG: radical SAM protein [Ignavibacteriae bacterium]|nr:radical SAM protein [Ignavibacteriota bacterium]
MIREKTVTSVLNKLKKRDSWFLVDYSANPYSGCSVNCLYCYIRGSKYGAEMAVTVKSNALQVFEKQLAARARKGQYGLIALASATDAYMPIENDRGATRAFLEIILKYRFPLHLITKSTLVLRDVELLREINKSAILPKDLQGKLQHGLILAFSFSTLDENLARIFEPAAPPPMERLEVLSKCREAGLFVGAHFIPLLPFLSDSEQHIDEMVRTAKQHVDFILMGSLTLFGTGSADSKTLVLKAVERYYPTLLPEYQKLYRYGHSAPQAYFEAIDRAAKAACKRHSVKYGIL